MIDVLVDRSWPSDLGSEYTRRHKVVKEPGHTKDFFAVTGPEGALLWVGGPLTNDTKALEQLRLHDHKGLFTEDTIDGIPWMGWDLGGHHTVQREDYYVRNDFCYVMDDGCWFDGGTALGAAEVLKKWIANRCSAEWMFEYLETRYDNWMTR